ncbi:hypothetical protein [Nocardioides bruguierae]|uniref:hypothetical protein n=1 Tax=Nocardioides bruguierae TaxID=2945102 RepID=UPI0020229871|nr:hypothetical protein [Nocardioides bruguierae]MCL8024958.1 hypothetical protein [Nocardioides bruguierae]
MRTAHGQTGTETGTQTAVPARPSPSRARLRVAVRVLFVLAVLACAGVGLRGRWGDFVAALTGVRPLDLAGAAACVLVGLWLTAGTWLRLLRGFGHRLPPYEGPRVFFTGQLGKYIPGAVWSLGAHADLARPYGVGVRTAVATGLLFLVVNVATAGALAGALVTAGVPALPVPRWTGPIAVVLCLAALTPPVVDALGTRLARHGGRLGLGWGDMAVLCARMAATWLCYAGSVVALAPRPSLELLAVATGGFAAAYVVGVAVVVAPAGVGAREVALVALLAPHTGVGHATAIALVTRVLQTLGDFAAAAAAHGWAQARGRLAGRRSAPADRAGAAD